MPNQFSSSTFYLLGDLFHIRFESYPFICHFHRPVEENIKFGLVVFNHSPSFATIEKDSQYTRSKNPRLGVYAELTVLSDVL